MILNKEEFCNIIHMIEKQQKKTENFSKALSEICDGYPVFDTNNEYLAGLLLLLNKIFKQDPKAVGNPFEWYLFERDWKNPNNNDHIESFENYQVNINTAELLYDSLIAELESNEENNYEPTRQFFKKNGTILMDGEMIL